MADESFNPVPGDFMPGKRGRGNPNNRKVTVVIEWEGTELEARAFGRLTKQLIADFDGSPDRRLMFKLRQAWLTGCEKAGVADA